MVTLIADPHYTLEGPDFFLQSSALPVKVVLWNTDRAFFRWSLLAIRPLFFTPVQVNASPNSRICINFVSRCSGSHKFSLTSRVIQSRYRVERQDYLFVSNVDSYLVCTIQSTYVLHKLVIYSHLSLRQHD